MINNEQLEHYLKRFLGKEMPLFLAARGEPPVIRVNTLKSTAREVVDFLKAHQVDFEQVSYNPYAFILREDALPLSHTLPFFCGKIQYQGLSSQIPPLALDPQPTDVVLDMAAAPGSKTSQLAALMKNQGMIYANDISRQRLAVLNSNLQKLGVINTAVMNLPAERLGNLFPEQFDKVLLDAPCTALGTLADHPEIGGWWSFDKLKKLAQLQLRLLISGFKVLKPGGVMIYSTCSLAPEENEGVVHQLLEHYPVQVEDIRTVPTEQWLPGLTTFEDQPLDPSLRKAIRVMPHLHGMEGFFIVRLRKVRSHKRTSLNAASFVETLTADHPKVAPILAAISQQWGIETHFWHEFRFWLTRHRVWLTNKFWQQIPREGFNNVGLLLAEKKISGWKLFNASAQWLNKALTKRRIPLNEQALQELFAHGTISMSLKDGYYVLTYNQQIIASAYVHKNLLSIKRPHVFNLII